MANPRARGWGWWMADGSHGTGSSVNRSYREEKRSASRLVANVLFFVAGQMNYLKYAYCLLAYLICACVGEE